jgi:hypothetical protein
MVSLATLQGSSYSCEPSPTTIFGHSTTEFLLMVWKLQVQSHAVLLSHMVQRDKEPGSKMTNIGEHFLPPSGDLFTRRPEDDSSNCGQSSSDTGDLTYTWAPLGTSGTSLDCIKRRRSGEGQNDEDDGRPPKKPRCRLEHTSNEPEQFCFACHFHIHDPLRYSSRASDTKYRACEGRGWNNLMGLKYA